MVKLSANDVINLDDEPDEVKPELDAETVKKAKFIEGIFSGETSLEIIFKCEACGTTLGTPMLVATDATEQRDTSIVCDDNCAP